MIPYLAVAVATLVACEIAIRSPLVRTLATLNTSSRKAMSVVGSKRISDHWKERMLPAYAFRIMGASLGLLFWLIAIAAPVVAASALAHGSLADGSAFLFNPLVLVLMIVLGAGWIWGRNRLFG